MHALTHMSQTAGRVPVGLAAYAVTSAGTLASLAVLPDVEIHGLTGLSWLLLTVILVVVVARGSAAAWALSLPQAMEDAPERPSVLALTYHGTLLYDWAAAPIRHQQQQ